jgi:hypothetical protein
MKYIKTFFQEKEIPFKQWEIEDKSGFTHIINNELVIEFIQNDKQNHSKYAHVLRRIDFANGDINNYLRYLAEGIINL